MITPGEDLLEVKEFIPKYRTPSLLQTDSLFDTDDLSVWKEFDGTTAMESVRLPPKSPTHSPTSPISPTPSLSPSSSPDPSPSPPSSPSKRTPSVFDWSSYPSQPKLVASMAQACSPTVAVATAACVAKKRKALLEDFYEKRQTLVQQHHPHQTHHTPYQEEPQDLLNRVQLEIQRFFRANEIVARVVNEYQELLLHPAGTQLPSTIWQYDLPVLQEQVRQLTLNQIRLQHRLAQLGMFQEFPVFAQSHLNQLQLLTQLQLQQQQQRAHLEHLSLPRSSLQHTLSSLNTFGFASPLPPTLAIPSSSLSPPPSLSSLCASLSFPSLIVPPESIYTSNSHHVSSPPHSPSLPFSSLSLTPKCTLATLTSATASSSPSSASSFSESADRPSFSTSSPSSSSTSTSLSLPSAQETPTIFATVKNHVKESAYLVNNPLPELSVKIQQLLREAEDTKEKEHSECYPCPDCGKKVASRHSFQRHLKLHAGLRPFHCNFPLCGKKFPERSTLERHTRIHTGEKPFQCDHPGCTKSFSDASNLRRHRAIHTGYKPYRCHCGRMFSRKISLKKHYTTVHSREVVN